MATATFYNSPKEITSSKTISEKEDQIKVYLINGNPSVWNARDAVILRQNYRIVGVLVGCLPRAPRQNGQLGLPLQLMPEEITLLLEKGFVKLIKEKTFTADSSVFHKKELDYCQRANFEAQQKLYKEERRKEMLRQMPLIIEGKKAKKRKMMEAAGKIVTEEDLAAEEELNLSIVPEMVTPEKHMLLQLFTENPWKRETECALADWTYPKTDAEKLKYAVFRDLWEKNYYLTSGQKFGGDFLAYPGDPSRFHSFYIVICVDQFQQLSALDIISIGRLGSNVRKTVLLSSIDNNGCVQHTSLQWTGMA